MPPTVYDEIVLIVTKSASAHADTVPDDTGITPRAVMAEMNGKAEWNDWAADERLSLLQLRDRIVDGILATHGEYFSQSRAALGLDPSDSAVRNSAEGMVRLAFQTVGGSFDAPTVQSLAKVVNMLAERVLGWGASPDDIFEHHCTLMRDIGRLEMIQAAELNAALNGN